MKSKRKNVQDATLKNIRALKKRVSALEDRILALEALDALMDVIRADCAESIGVER